MAKKPVICIMYDFDKTLCTDDMQNFKFIPDLNMTPGEFWGKTGEFSDRTGVERILSYMYVMIEEGKKHGIEITKDYLKSCGESLIYYKGVEDWFDRINKFGASHGFKIEHYVISSGLKEIIQGSKIFNKFTGVYACEYIYDNEGRASWPKLVINYTQKTQFVFRISKGVKKISDDDKVNSRVKKEERHVLYKNMIYIGDGVTDIPCMQLIKDKGGNSIAVYKQSKIGATTEQLSTEERTNFVCKADYSENSSLDMIVKTIILNRETNQKLETIDVKERKVISKKAMKDKMEAENN